jgi:hypothetical protein
VRCDVTRKYSLGDVFHDTDWGKYTQAWTNTSNSRQHIQQSRANFFLFFDDSDFECIGYITEVRKNSSRSVDAIVHFINCCWQTDKDTFCTKKNYRTEVQKFPFLLHVWPLLLDSAGLGSSQNVLQQVDIRISPLRMIKEWTVVASESCSARGYTTKHRITGIVNRETPGWSCLFCRERHAKELCCGCAGSIERGRPFLWQRTAGDCGARRSSGTLPYFQERSTIRRISGGAICETSFGRDAVQGE